MSGVCPTPAKRTRNTFDDTVPERGLYLITGPEAKFNQCGVANNSEITVPPSEGGETVITNTICCPSPGPAGPAGAAGATGPAGADGFGFQWQGAWALSNSYIIATTPLPTTDIVFHNGSTYICTADHTASAANEPGVGASWQTVWDLFVESGGTGTVNWLGVWNTNVSYVENDFVTHNNASYMCIADHLSAEDSEPDPDFDYEGGLFWTLASRGPNEEEQSLIGGLAGGLFDWVSDIENWGLEDYVGAVLLGGGLIWAGTELNDMFDAPPEGDGEAGSIYTGDATYTTPYTSPTLIATIEKLCDYAGITTYDTSALDPAVLVNTTIASSTTVRNILDILSRTYHFSMVDSGGTLKFIPVDSNAAAVSLDQYTDIGFVQNGGTLGAPYFVKRIQGNDLPKAIELTYMSETNAHNEFTQRVPADPFYEEGTVVKLSVPVTLDDNEAYQIAERIFVNSHLERTTYTFTSTYKFIKLEPGDFVDIPDVGTLRIIRVDEKQDGLLTFTCTDAGPDRTILAESSSINAATPPTYTDVTPSIGYSAGLSVELPPMDSSDVEPRISLFPHGFGAAGWQGCSIHISSDGGLNYDNFSPAYNQATWGRIGSGAVGSVSDVDVWDESTVISVELKSGTLSSVTELEVLNGSNWALCGEEIIGFKNATLVSGTTYNLSGLLRGRRGTDVYVSTHVNTEVFILLDGAQVEFPYSIDQKETTFFVKFVTIGSDISKATAYSFKPNLKSRRPWAPANLVATNTANTWNIGWTARNQFNGEMVDSGTVTKPFQFGGYVMQVLNPGNDAVVRSVVQQTDTFVYNETLQIQDFGSTQSLIKIRVAQTDLDTGTGYTTTETFGA